MDVLESEVHKDTNSILSVWDDVKIAISNHPEADYHNTYLLFTHKEYLERINELIAKYSEA